MKDVYGKKGILFFYVFDLVLLLILLLAFLPLGRKKHNTFSETALLNPENEAKVCKIVIAKQNEFVTLYKEPDAGVWYGTDSFSNSKLKWPLDEQTVSNLFAAACKVEKVRVAAKGVKSWDNLGVDEKNAYSIAFYGSEGEVLSWLYFGFDDPLTQRIPFRTWQDQTVYEIASGIKSFLVVDESFWADPFIYPQSVTGYTRSEAERGLRRGLLEALIPRDGLKPDYTIKKDFGNGSEAVLSIYKKDDEYVVIPAFKAGPAYSETDKKVLEELNYRYTVSAYTVNRIIGEKN